MSEEVLLKLYVDHREPEKLKEWLRNNLGVECVFENLPAGDFEFRLGGSSRLLIERKEIADLCSSLRDGRFDDQKQKLSACVSSEPRPIAFLIEGDHTQHEMVNTIESIMLTTRFRDGFFVLRTDADVMGPQSTASTLLRLAELFQRGKLDPISEEEQHRRFIASRSMHRAGGGLSRKQDWWQLALAQIDGVGPKAAEAVTAKYPTADALMCAYRGCKSPAYRDQLLADVPMGKRRVGPAISERISKTVYPTGDNLTAAVAPRQRASASASASARKTFTPKPVTNECLFSDD